MQDMQTALECLLNAVEPLAHRTVPASECMGCVLAEDLHVAHPFPDTPRSAVDGYALGAYTEQVYVLTQRIAAGESGRNPLRAGEAAAVMTGATVPQGSVAVVRIEDTHEDQGRVHVHTKVEPGSNINQVGEEAAPGSPFMTQGQRISAIDSSVMCYAGTGQVKVYASPVVGILITGSELLEAGDPYQKGKTYNSNCHLLRNIFTCLGLSCIIRGPIDDDPALVHAEVEQLARQCHVVVSSGGVSMGKYDYVRPLLLSDPDAVLVNRTRIKPGRPLVVARRDTALCFGMPGYPAAFLTNMFVYLLPVLKKMAGWCSYRPEWCPVKLDAPARGREGRCDLVRARLSYAQGKVSACPLDDQMTSHYLNMAQCDALLLLDTSSATVPAGEQVPALIFRHELC